MCKHVLPDSSVAAASEWIPKSVMYDSTSACSPYRQHSSASSTSSADGLGNEEVEGVESMVCGVVRVLALEGDPARRREGGVG